MSVTNASIPRLSFPRTHPCSFSSTASGRLPNLDCEHCHGVTAVNFGYPLVRPAELKGFVFDDNWDTPSVGLADFEKIQACGKAIYGEDVLLMPGAQVGEFDIYAHGSSPKHLFEIERVEPGGILFSMRILDALSCSDIFLPNVRHELRQADGKVRFYGLTQAPVYRILLPISIKDTGCQQCVHCGCVSPVRVNSTIPPILYFDSAAKNSIAPVFRVVGYEASLFLRDDVARIFQAIDNLGADLQPWGQWM